MSFVSIKLPLESKRLRLRRFTRADLEMFVAYRAQPEVARLQLWDSYTLEDAQAFLEVQKTQMLGQPDSRVQLAVESKETGHLLGDLYVHTLSDPRQLELGYTLALEQQGKGYMTEAVTTFLDAWFADPNHHRVQATTDPRNLGSIALLERLNFRREAHFVKSMWFKGAWADDLVYAILRCEWLLR